MTTPHAVAILGHDLAAAGDFMHVGLPLLGLVLTTQPIPLLRGSAL